MGQIKNFLFCLLYGMLFSAVFSLINVITFIPFAGIDGSARWFIETTLASIIPSIVIFRLLYFYLSRAQINVWKNLILGFILGYIIVFFNLSIGNSIVDAILNPSANINRVFDFNSTSIYSFYFFLPSGLTTFAGISLFSWIIKRIQSYK